MIPEFLIITQLISSHNGIGKKIVNNLLIVSNAFFGGPVFRRPAIRRNKSTIGPAFQVIVPEQANLFKQRIGCFAEVILITPKGKMFPNMLGIPGTAGRIPFPE